MTCLVCEFKRLSQTDSSRDDALEAQSETSTGDTVALNEDVHLPSKDQFLGKTFADKYKVLSVLGQGGMSVVYKVEHIHLNTVLALKVLHKHLWSDPLAVDRFRMEAKSVNDLKHPNLIEYKDYGVYDGQPYLIMKYLEGQSLEKRIKESGGMPVSKVMDVFEALCKGLEVAHSRGLIHRDIKPANVILESNDLENVLLVDFGIAKIMHEDPTIQLTQTGEIFGSPPYMSPEQCQGIELDQRSDIYSLGCLVYEALTGRPPIEAGNLMEVIKRQISEVPKLPSKAKPELLNNESKGIRISDVEYIVMRCLEKDRKERYSTVSELLVDIQQIQSRNTIKKKTISKRVMKKNLLRLAVVSVILFPVFFYFGYFLHKGFQYFTDRGITHASCMARLWLGDIGIHIGDYTNAKWFLDGALSDAANERDAIDSRNLKLDAYIRLYTIYTKTGQVDRQKEIANQIREELKSLKH